MTTKKVLTPPKKTSAQKRLESTNRKRAAGRAELEKEIKARRAARGPNPAGFIVENPPVPAGTANRTNLVRWKKPSPVIKKTPKK